MNPCSPKLLSARIFYHRDRNKTRTDSNLILLGDLLSLLPAQHWCQIWQFPLLIASHVHTQAVGGFKHDGADDILDPPLQAQTRRALMLSICDAEHLRCWAAFCCAQRPACHTAHLRWPSQPPSQLRLHCFCLVGKVREAQGKHQLVLVSVDRQGFLRLPCVVLNHLLQSIWKTLSNSSSLCA